MIRNDGCCFQIGEKIKLKGKIIVLITYIIQAVILVGYAIYYLTKKGNNSKANDPFYLAVSVALAVFNLVFLIMGILKGYVLHIISYAIMSIFSSIVFDYVAVLIISERATETKSKWLLFLIGGIIMSLCTIAQLIIAPFIYRYYQIEKLMQIGASLKIWSLYWHTSLLKSMSLLQELLYLYLAFFTLMFQVDASNKNYIFIIELTLEILFIIVFTAQAILAWIMVNWNKKALFCAWIILNFITFTYQVYKIVCAFLGYSIAWQLLRTTTVNLRDHYVAYTILSILLIIVFVLSLIGGSKCLRDFETIEYKHLQERLGYVEPSQQYEISNEMSSEIGS